MATGFETVPSDGKRCDLVGCSNAEETKRDTGTKRDEEMADEDKNEQIPCYMSKVIPIFVSVKHISSSR